MPFFNRLRKNENIQTNDQTKSIDSHEIHNKEINITTNVETTKSYDVKDKIVKKYLSNRNVRELTPIWNLNDDNLLEKLDSYEGFEDIISDNLYCTKEFESDYRKATSLEEKKEILSTIKYLEIQSKFIEDFEKLYEIINRKSHISKRDLFLSIIDEIEIISFNYFESLFDSKFDYFNEIISDDVTNYDFIYEFCKYINHNSDEFTNIGPIFYASILSKYGRKISKKEHLLELIKIAEHNAELDFFEENLGKERPAIRNFSVENEYDEMDGYEFEEFIASLFEKQGYNVWNTPKSGDQGADIIIEDCNEKTVVQVKKYEGKVSNIAVQQVVASKNYYSADSAMVVTNSEFTHSAVELAKANDVSLIDGAELKKIVNSLNYTVEIDQELNDEEIRIFKESANILMENLLEESVTNENVDSFFKELMILKEECEKDPKSYAINIFLNTEYYYDCICEYLNEHGFSITPKEFENYWEKNELELMSSFLQSSTHLDEYGNKHFIYNIECILCKQNVTIDKVPNSDEYFADEITVEVTCPNCGYKIKFHRPLKNKQKYYFINLNTNIEYSPGED